MNIFILGYEYLNICKTTIALVPQSVMYMYMYMYIKAAQLEDDNIHVHVPYSLGGVIRNIKHQQNLDPPTHHGIFYNI